MLLLPVLAVKLSTQWEGGGTDRATTTFTSALTLHPAYREGLLWDRQQGGLQGKLAPLGELALLKAHLHGVVGLLGISWSPGYANAGIDIANSPIQ